MSSPSPDPRLSDEELDAIEAWGDRALAQWKRYPESTYGVCDYTDKLPTHSIRSQMLSLVREVRAGQERETALRTALESLVEGADWLFDIAQHSHERFLFPDDRMLKAESAIGAARGVLND